jgi:uncharacterized protein YdaU (DUF1376 family)
MTHPCLPLWVDDFEAATAHLSPEEDGVYNRLLRLTWRTAGCSLPVDHAWIARKVRMAPEHFERVGTAILTEFFRVSRGRYVQKRLKDEYDNISRKKLARQNAGKSGGLAKARKTKDNVPSNASGLPTDTRASSKPYPDPEPEREEKVRALFPEQASPAAAVESGKAAAAKGTRLKTDWRPSADNYAYAVAQGFTAEQVDRIAEDFRDFWCAKAGKDALKLDWSLTWQRWVRNTDRKIVARATAPKRVGFV